jgi:hypothetical protein
MCDAVVGRIVAWLALVVEGRMLLLLLVLLVPAFASAQQA